MTEPRSLVIAGAQRSASTSLAEHFGRHPAVAMAPREVLALEDPYYPKLLPALVRHVRDAHRQGLVAGLKRPELLHRPEGAERLAAHVPNPVVLISLREPISRTVSAYHHYVRNGLIPNWPVERGLSHLLDRRNRRLSWKPGDQVLAYSMYAESVRRYVDNPALRSIVIFQEELVVEPQTVVNDVLRHLCLPPSDLGTLVRANAAPRLDRIGLERLANRIGYEVRAEAEYFEVTPMLVRRGASKALRVIARRLPSMQGSNRPVSEELRRRLGEHFADDVLNLERLLHRPVPPVWRAELML